jgi:hypothetical protein
MPIPISVRAAPARSWRNVTACRASAVRGSPSSSAAIRKIFKDADTDAEKYPVKGCVSASESVLHRELGVEPARRERKGFFALEPVVKVAWLIAS